MSIKSKKIFYILLLAGCSLSGYYLWLSLRPIEIVAVHHRSSGFSDVLVKNFPLTDRGKIDWWLNNRNMLKEKYNIPSPSANGYFYVTFWLFGEGYKEEGKYDRLCFKDMQPPVNCIEKDAIFSVDKSPNLGTVFTVYDGGDYRLDKNGKIVEIHHK